MGYLRGYLPGKVNQGPFPGLAGVSPGKNLGVARSLSIVLRVTTKDSAGLTGNRIAGCIGQFPKPTGAYMVNQALIQQVISGAERRYSKERKYE
jgi:hypothetical protein